jgi:lipopolysaccharide transport system ATP-binding protein
MKSTVTDVLVKVDHVSKKFCRDLKRSLWYGVKDTVGDLIGLDGSTQHLRPDEFWAVDDVSFEVRRGECLGLIGHNGAGKTTLLKMLNGLVKPDNGRIEMRGRVGALIALGAGFNPILTGRENIYVNGSVLGLGRREIEAKIDEIIDFAGIGNFIDAPVQSYSSGMAVRLGFAIAAATSPDVLLLDEVLAVGDVAFIAKCFNTLAEFRKRGTAFIFVSHNMHMITRYCQHVIYLRRGQVRHAGDVAEGVGQLLRDMGNDASNVASDHRIWSDATGTGKIKFCGFQFLNAFNELVTEINAGEAVTLVLDYESHAANVRNPVIDLVVRDNTQVVYQGTNVSSGQSFDSVPERGKFRVHFDTMPINADRLEFSVALFDGETMELFDWKRHIALGVNRNPLFNGALVLPTTWSVIS